MREKNVQLIEGVKILKKRASTSQEQEDYLNKKRKSAREKGQELKDGVRLEKFICEAKQDFIREKDGREATAQLDIRTDLQEIEPNKTYTVFADWSVNVQGIYLLRALAVVEEKVEGKKDGK